MVEPTLVGLGTVARATVAAGAMSLEHSLCPGGQLRASQLG